MAKFMKEQTGGFQKAVYEEFTRPFRYVQMDLTDGYVHAVVMTCIQTKLTNLLMPFSGSIESLTHAINALIAEKGPPEVICLDKESAVAAITKYNQLQDSLFQDYKTNFRFYPAISHRILSLIQQRIRRIQILSWTRNPGVVM